MLQRLYRRDEHDCAWCQPAEPAGDVDELLEAHLRAEAALGDDVVAELQPEAAAHQGAIAVRDVREGAAVHEGRLPFEGLHEVRLQSVGQQRGHRAGGADLLGRDRLAVKRRPDGDRAEPAPQVSVTARDGDDRHHLGRRGDVEARLAGRAVGGPSEADHQPAQRPVVHVQAPSPGDGLGIELERISVQQRRLDHGGQQVVRGPDRMDVAGEMEIDQVLRHDLRQAAAGATALDPEDGAEGRLA
jgi:hypothetical protein